MAVWHNSLCLLKCAQEKNVPWTITAPWRMRNLWKRSEPKLPGANKDQAPFRSAMSPTTSFHSLETMLPNPSSNLYMTSECWLQNDMETFVAGCYTVIMIGMQPSLSSKDGSPNPGSVDLIFKCGNFLSLTFSIIPSKDTEGIHFKGLSSCHLGIRKRVQCWISCSIILSGLIGKALETFWQARE